MVTQLRGPPDPSEKVYETRAVGKPSLLVITRRDGAVLTLDEPTWADLGSDPGLPLLPDPLTGEHHAVRFTNLGPGSGKS